MESLGTEPSSLRAVPFVIFPVTSTGIVVSVQDFVERVTVKPPSTQSWEPSSGSSAPLHGGQTSMSPALTKKERLASASLVLCAKQPCAMWVCVASIILMNMARLRE